MKAILDGKYEIKREIGRGGMGVIYEALHAGLNRSVAVKVLHPHFSGDPAFLKRFQREARAMARLDHVNIIRVFDVGEDEGLHYIVMEYFPAKDLKQVVLERGTLPQQEVLIYALQMTKALSYAHSSGIIHRDIKPANIMVNNVGLVKIADFGIAAATDEASVTATGNVIGTPEYMSVEQARGEVLDARSDLYSVGMVIYELLTGATSFSGVSKIAILGKLVYEKEEYALNFNAQILPAIQNIIRSLLKKDKIQRIENTTLLVKALDAALLELKSPGSDVNLSDETCLADIPLMEGPSSKVPISLQAPEVLPLKADLQSSSVVDPANTGPLQNEVDESLQTVILHVTPPSISQAAGMPHPEDKQGPASEETEGPGLLPESKTRENPNEAMPAGPNLRRVAAIVGGLAILVVAFAFFLSGMNEGPAVPVPSALDKVVFIRNAVFEVRGKLKISHEVADEAGAPRWVKELYGEAFDLESRGEKHLDEAETFIKNEVFDDASQKLKEALRLFKQANLGFTEASSRAETKMREAKALKASQKKEADQQAKAKKAEAKRSNELAILRSEQAVLKAEQKKLRQEQQAQEERRAEEKKQAEKKLAEEEARAEAELVRQRIAEEKAAVAAALLAKKKRSVENIRILGERLNQIKLSYQNKDLKALQGMTQMSAKRANFLKQIFDNYEKVKVEVAALSATGDEAKATITILELSSLDGNRVLPSARWKDAVIHFVYKGGLWEKARW